MGGGATPALTPTPLFLYNVGNEADCGFVFVKLWTRFSQILVRYLAVLGSSKLAVVRPSSPAVRMLI